MCAKKSFFITIEGPEGSGKTTHILPLARFLRECGHNVFATREPGGTSIGDQIRSIVTNLENIEMHPRTEILLFQASRAQVVEQVIKPHMANGEIVLCDRYADSTLAYQGYGHQTNIEELHDLIRFATGGLMPDITILLDIDVRLGLRRKTTNGEWNRLDALTFEFHQRVRNGYLELAKKEPERWIVIDAQQPSDTVQDEMRKSIIKRLESDT
ncbi:MAG: dTMP kinase [Chloroflexota bacterium]